jgi:lipopolysaccharide transport system ATP-binding protein
LPTLYEAILSDYAIRVESLSKEYVIGAREQPYYTLREALAQGIAAPFRRLLNTHRGPDPKQTFLALNNVDFQINRGEVVGIIGRNGAGKSTLLKILSRITEPSRGRVAVRGRVASLLEVGTGFHPELTGRENIFLNGAILGMTRSEVRQRFDEIVSFADVERFIDTPVKFYSSGMYMRLAFAIAAHLETDILLIDEVLAVGDASFQQKCLAKMQDVAGHGRTVLFVSHNMTAVQALCERVIHLADGQVKGDGDPKEEIQSYLSSSVIGQVEPKRLDLGGDINIVNLSLSPNPVESGKDLNFKLDLIANCALRLSEAAFILYAVEGPRVGIVDLRPAGFPFLMQAGERLRIEGVVRSIPLVERQYRVGLWIDSGPFVGELKDLVDLTVAPATAKSIYAPVGPQYRGWVEFKTECFSRSISGQEPSQVVCAGVAS